MSQNFHLRILTPDNVKYDGQAERIIVRTVTGDICILANHIDFTAPLAIGKAKLVDDKGETRLAACNSGFISVTDGEVLIASTTFEWADEIDAARAEAAKCSAEARLRDAKRGDIDYAKADASLRRALARLGASGK